MKRAARIVLLAAALGMLGYGMAHLDLASFARDERSSWRRRGIPERVIVLRNETDMFRFPFEYLATTEPACRGKAVVVCAATPGPLTKACPPPKPDALPTAASPTSSWSAFRGGPRRR